MSILIFRNFGAMHFMIQRTKHLSHFTHQFCFQFYRKTINAEMSCCMDIFYFPSINCSQVFENDQQSVSSQFQAHVSLFIASVSSSPLYVLQSKCITFLLFYKQKSKFLSQSMNHFRFSFYQQYLYRKGIFKEILRILHI